jgi:hypothetical protein
MSESPEAASAAHLSPEDELAIKIRAIFDELHPQQMAIFRRLSPARRSEIVFEMCDFVRSMVTASVRTRYPNIDEESLRQRVRERVMIAYEQ